MSEILQFYTGMDDWKGDYLAEITLFNTDRLTVKDKENLITGEGESWFSVNSDIKLLRGAVIALRGMCEHVIGRGVGRYWNVLLFDGFYMAAEFPEAEITWQKIVAAWADADITGRIFTVASIDFMRQEIWNEPVTSFALAPGGLGG